jgi:hypothetical protein
MRFFRLSTICILLIAPVQSNAEKVISCPDQIVSGCEIFTDPLGTPISPISCPVSHCKVFKPKIVDGKKVCPFNCPEFFDK